MMIIENLIFWVFALMAIGGALGVVFHRSILYSALFLIMVFMAIAGIFVLNNADFLAIAQVIVYGVGLTIVLLFGIMFTGDRLPADRGMTPSRLLAYLVVAGLFLGVLLPVAFYTYPVQSTPEALAAVFRLEGSTRLLGEALFNTYALPFEVASILLLLAMVGAIVLAKKTFDGEREAVKYELTETDLPPDAEEALRKAPFHQRWDAATLPSSKSQDPQPAESETVGV